MPCPFAVHEERPAYLREDAPDDGVLLDAMVGQEDEGLTSAAEAAATRTAAAAAATAGAGGLQGGASSSLSLEGAGGPGSAPERMLAREMATLLDRCGPVRGTLTVTGRVAVFEPFRSEPWVQVHGAARFRCVIPRSDVRAYVRASALRVLNKGSDPRTGTGAA
jgi:hypothetical protein